MAAHCRHRDERILEIVHLATVFSRKPYVRDVNRYRRCNLLHVFNARPGKMLCSASGFFCKLPLRLTRTALTYRSQGIIDIFCAAYRKGKFAASLARLLEKSAALEMLLTCTVKQIEPDVGIDCKHYRSLHWI